MVHRHLTLPPARAHTSLSATAQDQYFLVARSTTLFVPLLTDGSVVTTTGWQLSTRGAAGAASSATESNSKCRRH